MARMFSSVFLLTLAAMSNALGQSAAQLESCGAVFDHTWKVRVDTGDKEKDRILRKHLRQRIKVERTGVNQRSLKIRWYVLWTFYENDGPFVATCTHDKITGQLTGAVLEGFVDINGCRHRLELTVPYRGNSNQARLRFPDHHSKPVIGSPSSCDDHVKSKRGHQLETLHLGTAHGEH